MVQRVPSPRGDKNGADINLALDALEMAFTHDHVNAFAIVSGDSDFIPLVNKLKEYGKTVYVVGGKAFTSTILQQNCHEFVSYESLLDDEPRRGGRPPRRRASLAARRQQRAGPPDRGAEPLPAERREIATGGRVSARAARSGAGNAAGRARSAGSGAPGRAASAWLTEIDDAATRFGLQRTRLWLRELSPSLSSG